MDKIFYGGLIKTVDNAYPYVEAVAVQDGVIVALGKYDDVIKYKTDNTEMIDLKGKFMYPGFMDCHMHMINRHFCNMGVDLTKCTTQKEALDLIEAEYKKMKAAGKGGWLVAVGFNQYDWSDKQEVPNRLVLDEIAPDVNVAVQRCCGHTVAYNTMGLKTVGVFDEKPGTKDVNMLFLEDGTPQGQLFEGDAGKFMDYMDVPSVDEYVEWIKEETEYYASLGLVAIHSDDFNMVAPLRDNENVMAGLKKSAETGDMKIRIYEQCRHESKDILEAFIAKYPLGTQFGKYGKFKTVCIKEMIDGSLGAHSAVMRNGYLNDPDAISVQVHTDEELFELVEIANAAGYPVAGHCIGDGAVEQLLNAFEYSQKKHPMADVRNGIVHCQIMGFDQLDRMQATNVVAYCQPVFVGTDAAIVDDCVGVEVGKQSYNWRKMWDLGIHVASGSDCPVESCDPINNIYYAVTRDGGNGVAWDPENAMTMEEAIRAHTIEGAYAAYEESRRGSITAGKYADFVVLDRNLMEIDPWTVKDTKVLMTVVDGEIVYEA